MKSLELESLGVVGLDQNQQMKVDGGGNYTYDQMMGIINQMLNSDISTITFSSNGDGSFNASGYCIGHDTGNASIWMFNA